MSFQVPQNVPSFNSTGRNFEDSQWRYKNKPEITKRGGISSKINDMLSKDENLPMYKDKPHFPSSRRRRQLSGNQTLGLFAVCLICFLWVLGVFSPGKYNDKSTYNSSISKSNAKPTSKTWNERREAVKDVFVTSWDGYAKYAWGMDEYHPISRKGKNMVAGGMGWMIVDSLDTAMMMNLTSQVAASRKWMSSSLFYNADHDVNTFETTIRMLGGLLSAHYLSTTYPNLAPLRDDDVNQPGEDLYIEKAMDLAERLIGAYESPSGIPFASVNLNTSLGISSHTEGGASSTAEAGTLQLEMKYMSKLTGEPVFWQRAEHVMKVIDDQHSEDGLTPIFIHPVTGTFRGQNIRLGSRGDSYYEYLIKQYLQTGGEETVYLDMWDEALEGIKKHLITYSTNANLTILAERQNGLHLPLTAKMDHLVCFLPGTIALAVTGGKTVTEAKKALGKEWTPKHDQNLKLAEELMKTCWGMYKVTATGLAAEITYFHTDNPARQWQGHLDPEWTPPVSAEIDGDEGNNPRAPWRKDYDIHNNDVHSLQRPETVESLFYMYRITGDEKYREWGWRMFESFRQHTKVIDEVEGLVYAYTSLDTVQENPVDERRKRDNMESFWLAETLKYFYLLFSDNDFFPLTDVVINTEAHFFPRFSIKGSEVFKTGWTRLKKEKKVVSIVETGQPEIRQTESVVQSPTKAVVGVDDDNGKENSQPKPPRFQKVERDEDVGDFYTMAEPLVPAESKSISKRSVHSRRVKEEEEDDDGDGID